MQTTFTEIVRKAVKNLKEKDYGQIVYLFATLHPVEFLNAIGEIPDTQRFNLDNEIIDILTKNTKQKTSAQRKIAAIKYCREKTGMELIEARQYVYKIINERNLYWQT